MSSLLELVLEANGADRFASLSTITATARYGGSFWEVKGHPDYAGAAVVEARAHEQWIRQTDADGGVQMVFDRAANLITVTESNGDVIEELHDPRRSFDGYTERSVWSEAQMAYFRCYATWLHLVEPFVFAFPGVTSHEIAAHSEHGEIWRGLSVTFPPEVDSHNRTQLYYFDEEYRLRRSDVQPEVDDYTKTTQYVAEHVEIDGITLSTSRRVHLRLPDRSPDTTRTPVTVDLSDIHLDSTNVPREATAVRIPPE
ncbi:hypothetical protein [Agromyces sp. NPDC058126]|uniref:hypothetical protein n=1 Tax=Agromyces sp. NPDC058126 TaxID=3346350 RepID=UPI0036D83399